MKGQSNELLAALGGSPGCVVVGSADETALGQVRYAASTWANAAWYLQLGGPVVSASDQPGWS